MSPGACFAVTVRNSAIYGRKVGVLTALGIGLSTCFQKAYVLLGFGLFISKYPVLFHMVKIVGCAHLMYLAYCCWRNSFKKKGMSGPSRQGRAPALSSKGAFRSGFLTDALNPQASFGFMSIVVATVSPSTPLAIQGGYAFFLILSAMMWYVMVAIFFSHARFRGWFSNAQHWFERIMGSVLIGLSCRLAFVTIR